MRYTPTLLLSSASLWRELVPYSRLEAEPLAMQSFDIPTWQSEHRKVAHAVHMSQPVEVACYSRASDLSGGQIQYNSRAELQTFKAPSLPADLAQGYPEAYVRKDETREDGVEPVCQSVIKAGQEWSGCDICTYRNNLNKIASTVAPGRSPSPWVIDGCQVNGTLYLDIQKLEQKTFPDADRFSYFGYRLEALCTGTATDATSEFCSVLRLNLGGHKIYMGAEVDCWDPLLSPEPVLQAYVELKSYKLPSNQRQDENIKRYKHPSWWIQSYLAGIRTLVLGGRNEQGILHRLDSIRVSQLPALSAAAGCQWDPNKLLAFCRDTLGWMRDCADKHPGEHLRFSYGGNTSDHIQCSVQNGSLPSRMKAILGEAT